MVEHTNKYPGDITCLRQLYDYDLKSLIEKKSNEGHKIMVVGDFNAQYSELVRVDVLHDKHGICPITYRRSHKDPLDCCFGDPNMKIRRGGCLAFGRLVGDH